jgi:hypothetical protein
VRHLPHISLFFKKLTSGRKATGRISVKREAVRSRSAYVGRFGCVRKDKTDKKLHIRSKISPN